jgi:hypothetical protein
MWVLLPVGILMFLAGRMSRKTIEPTGGRETLEAEEHRREQEAKAARESAEAADERDSRVEAIEQEHADTVARLNEKQKREAEELRRDPDKLNEFLLQVGKEARGG